MSHLERAKAALTRLRGAGGEAEARYRAVCWWLFRLAQLGPEADPAECTRALNEQIALADDLGWARADVIRHEEARRWWVETGCCPWSGERGACHEPGGL